MAERFVRDLVLALGTILVMAVMIYVDIDYVEPVKDYVSFIVSTDFSLQPVLKKVDFLRAVAEWDAAAWFKTWPQISSGR